MTTEGGGPVKRTFISHAAEDAASAHRLAAALEARGVACWVAPRDIPAGRDYAEAIVEGIRNAGSMLVLISARSMSSPHVRREVERAVNLDIELLPVRLEPVEPTGAFEYFISGTQRLDAFPAAIEHHAMPR